MPGCDISDLEHRAEGTCSSKIAHRFRGLELVELNSLEDKDGGRKPA